MDRCSRDVAPAPVTSSGGAPVEHPLSIRDRLVTCADSARGVSEERQGQGGAGGEGGAPPVESGPRWCHENCVVGSCDALASCLTATFTSPAARGQADAILLAGVVLPIPGQESIQDAFGCWSGAGTPDATATTALCAALGNPTVFLAGGLQDVTRIGRLGPCSEVLGQRTTLGTILAGAYAPALDFQMADGSCERVTGEPQLAAAGQERVFRLQVATETAGKRQALANTTTCASTMSGGDAACLTSSDESTQ